MAEPTTTETETKTKTEPVGITSKDKLFKDLPDGVRTLIDTMPTPFNDREKRKEHLSPRMARLIKAIRQTLGNVSQKTLAENQFAKDKGEDNRPFRTTHCQIATLEQGGCKRGANEQTVALLAHALQVKPAVIEAINKADLEERAERGDDQAKKILGIVEEEKAETPSEAAGKDAAKAGDKDAAPDTSGSKPSPEAKKTTPAPPAKSATTTSREPVKV